VLTVSEEGRDERIPFEGEVGMACALDRVTGEAAKAEKRVGRSRSESSGVKSSDE
jgi:hypothetical protein